MNPPAPQSVRIRMAIFLALLFLWLMIAGLYGCGGPSAPTSPETRSPLRHVTVSGPPLPAILALPAEITRGTGLEARYIGETGGSMAFVVGTVPAEYCSWTIDRTATRSTSVFPSLAAMENEDREGGCDRLKNSALHEAGHGLGLWSGALLHPEPPCDGSVMCIGEGRRTERTWGAGDLEALGRLYR